MKVKIGDWVRARDGLEKWWENYYEVTGIYPPCGDKTGKIILKTSNGDEYSYVYKSDKDWEVMEMVNVPINGGAAQSASVGEIKKIRDENGNIVGASDNIIGRESSGGCGIAGNAQQNVQCEEVKQEDIMDLTRRMLE